MANDPHPSREVTLLIDGDILAFRAAAAAQRVIEDDFGFVQPFAYRPEGEAIVDNLIIGLEQDFKSTHTRVVLSDPEDNWRNQIYPAYKSNRKDTIRPLLLGKLKQYLREKYGAFHWPSLEADDVLGILCTEPQEYPGERILVGYDKDFLTIPCKYHRVGERIPGTKKPLVRETTEWEAQRNLLKQTLTGDATDGYPGCPNIGARRVEALLDDPVLLVPQPGVKTRGVNKGESTTKWVAEPTTDLWAMVVSHFKKGRQDEAAALCMARLAHILQHGDYNRETQEIRLWTPDALKQF